jgi:hypothetical protein
MKVQIFVGLPGNVEKDFAEWMTMNASKIMILERFFAASSSDPNGVFTAHIAIFYNDK